MSTSQRQPATKDASKTPPEAPRRGRVIPSRYMNATASSRAAVASKAASAQQKPSSSTLGSIRRANAASTRSNLPANATSTTKVARTQLSSVSVYQPPGQSSRSHLTDSISTGFNSAVELDLAAQLYPWLFMRHTLTEVSDTTATKAQAVLSIRAKELEFEEQALADDNVRYQAEQETRLIDELLHERLCRVVPSLIQNFVHSQHECQDAIFHTTQIVNSRHDWNMNDAHLWLQKIERFAAESTVLRTEICELARTLASDSLLVTTLHDILRLLDARVENLRLSGELLTKTRDNFITICHLESLDIQVL